MGAGASSAAPFPAAGPALALPWFSKLLPVSPLTPATGDPWFAAAVLPHHATLGCALAEGRSLPAAYSLTWEERGTQRQKGTEAGARASSQCSPLWGGDIRRLPGLAAQGSSAFARGSAAGRAGCLCCPLRHCGSAPCPSQHRKSGCHSCCGALPPPPPPPAQSPPPPHTRARRHTRPPQTHGCTHINTCAHTHAHPRMPIVWWEPVCA